MNRRGLTLLELLLAIGLLLALGALVFPAVMDSLHERAFESSAEVARNQLLLARSHAQATGEPVEVMYHSDPSRVEARLFQAALRAIEQADYLEARRSAEQRRPDPLSLEYDESDREGLISEGWAYRRLADGVWITDRPTSHSPGFDEEDESSLVEHDRRALDDPPEQRRTIRLAVFMPDGSALLGEPVWLGDDHGRVGKLQVNPWTGLPSFERIAKTAGESLPLDEAEPQDERDRFFEDDTEPQEMPEQPSDGEAEREAEESIEP